MLIYKKCAYCGTRSMATQMSHGGFRWFHPACAAAATAEKRAERRQGHWGVQPGVEFAPIPTQHQSPPGEQTRQQGNGLLKGGVAKFKSLSTRNKAIVLGGFLVFWGVGSLLPVPETTSTPASAASTTSLPTTPTTVSPVEAANCSDRVDTWNDTAQQTITLISSTRAYASEVSKYQLKSTAEAGITAARVILGDCESGLSQGAAGLFHIRLDQLETYRNIL